MSSSPRRGVRALRSTISQPAAREPRGDQLLAARPSRWRATVIGERDASAIVADA